MTHILVSVLVNMHWGYESVASFIKVTETVSE